MGNIRSLLEQSIKRSSQNTSVAILLSGGADSISVAFAAMNLGKNINAYSFHLDTHLSYDFKKAKEVSDKFGWKFSEITIPTKRLFSDFKKLASIQKNICAEC